MELYLNNLNTTYVRMGVWLREHHKSVTPTFKEFRSHKGNMKVPELSIVPLL